MQGIEHYENFPVASWLCPAPLRAPIRAIYHFARTADDLADEGDMAAAERLADLAAFRRDWLAHLEAGPDSHASPPSRWSAVLAPLAREVWAHQLPPTLLSDLLDAFEQDVRYTEAGRRYADRAELLDYCTRSANPIGRLLLHLNAVEDDPALKQSDAICSALQLINFWQDRQQDMRRGRDYLPLNSDLPSELNFARALMMEGAALVHRLPGRMGWELRGVVQGGLRILDALAQLSPAVLAQPLVQPRPRLSKWDVPVLAWRAWRMGGSIIQQR